MFDSENWKNIKPYLHKINNIHVLEQPLFSHHLEVAGTVDCIAEYNGKLSVIDFKTSTRHKNRDYITNYFCQASAYAIMFEERFKIPVSRIVILISVDGDEPQYFEDRRDVYIDQLLEVRKQYKERYGV